MIVDSDLREGPSVRMMEPPHLGEVVRERCLLIRPVSARYMHGKEAERYGEAGSATGE